MDTPNQLEQPMPDNIKPSIWHSIKHFVSIHKLIAASAAAILLILVIGIVAVSARLSNEGNPVKEEPVVSELEDQTREKDEDSAQNDSKDSDTNEDSVKPSLDNGMSNSQQNGSNGSESNSTADNPTTGPNTQESVVFGPSTRPFSASSPWNTTTPAATTWYDTPVLHNLPDSTPVQWFVSFGSLAIYYADSSDPLWTFDMPDYIAPAWNRNRPAESFQARGPSGLLDGGYYSGDTDHILTVVDVNTGNYVETWNTCVNTVSRIVQTGCGDPSHNGYPGWGRGNILTGNGAGTLTGENDGVRASNFSWIAGAITGRDIDNGYFDHALALSLPDYALAGAYAGLGSYRYPATAIDSGYASGPIFMGSKIGIPRSTPRPVGLSPLGNAMFDALQNYGAYVGDFTGGPWPVIYVDQNTVSESDIAPLQQWNGGLWTQLAPLLRVADYQP